MLFAETTTTMGWPDAAAAIAIVVGGVAMFYIFAKYILPKA